MAFDWSRCCKWKCNDYTIPLNLNLRFVHSKWRISEMQNCSSAVTWITRSVACFARAGVQISHANLRNSKKKFGEVGWSRYTTSTSYPSPLLIDIVASSAGAEVFAAVSFNETSAFWLYRICLRRVTITVSIYQNINIVAFDITAIKKCK